MRRNDGGVWIFVFGGLLFALAGVIFAAYSWSAADWEMQAARAVTVEADTAEEAPSVFTLQVLSVTRRQRVRRVYIYHTHTYEAYEMDADHPYQPTEQWRTADAQCNVVRVGEELAACLRAAGIIATHDTTAYEPPRLSTAYSRSLEGLQRAAEEEYDLYIDLHRDSYSKGNGANAVALEGKDAARILFLIGQGTGTDFDEKPEWQENEKVAKILSDLLNQRAEGLSRGVALKSGRYNQQAATPSMLIEVGNNKNTLPEALAAMEPLARSICAYFDGLE